MGTPNITIAAAIKEYRFELGLSQAQMAEKCGISRCCYVRIETGKNTNPRLRSIWFFIRSERVHMEAFSQCSNAGDHFHLVATE